MNTEEAFRVCIILDYLRFSSLEKLHYVVGGALGVTWIWVSITGLLAESFGSLKCHLNFLCLSFLIFIEGIYHLLCRMALRIGIKQLKYLAQSDFNTFKFHITFSNSEENIPQT